MALPISYRLKKRSDIDNVFQEGRSKGGAFLLLRFLPHKHPHTRFAVLVSTKVAPSAVARNRIKRILLDELGRCYNTVGGPYDMIFVVRRSATEDELRSDMQNIIRYIQGL